jgi:hypothetical protein
MQLAIEQSQVQLLQSNPQAVTTTQSDPNQKPIANQKSTRLLGKWRIVQNQLKWEWTISA